MAFDTQLITIPIFTVLKVLLVATIGGFSGKYFTFPQFSTKGISTMTVKIFLPAMLCSRLASDMNIETIKGGYGWAIVLCAVPLLLGYFLSTLFRHFIKQKEFHGLFLLACTFQNAVSFGLGVTQSIAGPSWITAATYSEFASIVFLWNLPHSLAIWAGGTWIVRRAKEDEVVSNYERDMIAYEEKKKEAALSITTQGETATTGVEMTSISSPDDVRALISESPRNDEHVHHEHLGQVGSVSDAQPIADVATGAKRKRMKRSGSYAGVNSASSVGSLASPTKKNATGAEEKKAEELKPPVMPNLPPRKEGFEAVKEFLVETFTNITILASLIGMAIGLIPPLKWLAKDTMLGPIFIGAMSTLGSATVPLTLLQLGTNLTSTQKEAPKRMIKVKESVTDPASGQVTVKEVEVEAPPRNVVAEYIANLEVPFIFILLVALVRLVIIPVVFLCLFLVLRSAGDIPLLGPLPSSKAFQLTILVESCAPTAINSIILCTMFQYKTSAYSQALLGIYVISIGTTACWLTFYLWLLG